MAPPQDELLPQEELLPQDELEEEDDDEVDEDEVDELGGCVAVIFHKHAALVIFPLIVHLAE